MGENVLVKGVSMTDFTTNIDMNVRMMNEKLRVDRNFENTFLLYRWIRTGRNN